MEKLKNGDELSSKELVDKINEIIDWINNENLIKKEMIRENMKQNEILEKIVKVFEQYKEVFKNA